MCPAKDSGAYPWDEIKISNCTQIPRMNMMFDILLYENFIKLFVVFGCMSIMLLLD